VLINEFPRESHECAISPIFRFGTLAMLTCLVVSNRIVPQRALTMDLSRKLTRRGERQRLADLWLAGKLAPGRVERAQGELCWPPVGAAKSHAPALMAGGLDDQEQAASAGIADAPALRPGRVSAARGIG